MSTSADIALVERYCAHNYAPLPVVMDKGQGVWLWDTEGRRYLDMISAYSAISHGHAHPKLLSVLIEQAKQLSVVSRACHSPALGKFAKRLCELSHLDMMLPMNTGAEAVETAIKAARSWGYQRKNIPQDQAQIIVAKGNFHGRTTTIIGFSSEPAYQKNFGPFAPGFIPVPFGQIEAVRAAITPQTCAVLFEPIQGEGGIVMPPPGFLKQLRQLCDEHNILLILDEIQSGLGRTGKLFAFEHENIIPDGITVGKALGGGFLPVSAFVAKKELMQVFTPGSHGSTFGGNPLAATVGLAALEQLLEDKLVERSATMGEYLIQRLRAIQHPALRDIRGQGLWVGVEVDSNIVDAHAIALNMLEQGVLIKETHDTVLRFSPPLIIEKSEIDFAVETFEIALKACSKAI